MTNHTTPKLTSAEIDALAFMLHHYKVDNLLVTLQLCTKFMNCLPDSTPDKQVYLNDIHGLEKIVHLLSHVNSSSEQTEVKSGGAAHP